MEESLAEISYYVSLSNLLVSFYHMVLTQATIEDVFLACRTSTVCVEQLINATWHLRIDGQRTILIPPLKDEIAGEKKQKHYNACNSSENIRITHPQLKRFSPHTCTQNDAA